EGAERHAREPVGKCLAQPRIEMLPEAAAAPYHVFPKPRLALVHAGRCAAAERRAFQLGPNALLVERVPRLVQGGEQRLGDMVLAHARGDAHVAGGELRAERMVRLVETAAVEVVAEAPDDGEAEGHLRRLGKRAEETAVVDRR